MAQNRHVDQTSTTPGDRATGDPFDHDAVVAWLETFARAVRERDYELGRTLMSPSCVGFGTVAKRVITLDELVERQWKSVWGRTQGFRFDLDKAVIQGGSDLVICCMVWSSEGIDEDGSTFPRNGRATIALAQTDKGLLGVHTHFSIAPGTRS